VGADQGGDKGGKAGETSVRKAPVPTGWKEYVAKRGSFKAYFPQPPEEPPAMDNPAELVPSWLYTAATPDDSLVVVVVALQFPPQLTKADRDKAMAAGAKGFTEGDGAAFKLISQKKITWLGQPATETVSEITEDGEKRTYVARQVLVGNIAYFGILADSKGRPKPEIENGFFDNFTPTK